MSTHLCSTVQNHQPSNKAAQINSQLQHPQHRGGELLPGARLSSRPSPTRRLRAFCPDLAQAAEMKRDLKAFSLIVLKSLNPPNGKARDTLKTKPKEKAALLSESFSCSQQALVRRRQDLGRLSTPRVSPGQHRHCDTKAQGAGHSDLSREKREHSPSHSQVERGAWKRDRPLPKYPAVPSLPLY